ncbi:MAG TPA: hypothetical protein HPP77_04790 [Candidatus Hydrogenedentes bacterium]|nr:hypothetical protein [Candidatus Hydrogenedentota bacterium]HIJ74973.1 hypothetical protein [Candidatus Hydrogenedentota bacterium]
MLSLLAILCVAASATLFNERVEEAHALLEQGDADGALAAYRNLQTDEPESDLLHYSIGCAQYEKSMADASAGAAEGAVELLSEAEKSLAKVAASPDAAIRERGGYNRANCRAQLAKQAAVAGQYELAAEKFQEALAAYDDFLRLYPDHKDARHNRDHIRYLLKKMLQNPPDQQGQNGDRNEQQDGDQQKQQESKDDQQAQQSGEEEEQREVDQQNEPAPSEPDQQPQDKSQEQGAEEEEQQDLDRRNIEAILDSLEDLDQRELYETKSKQGGYASGDWW